jgi:hypothetical protein
MPNCCSSLILATSSASLALFTKVDGVGGGPAADAPGLETLCGCLRELFSRPLLIMSSGWPLMLARSAMEAGPVWLVNGVGVDGWWTFGRRGVLGVVAARASAEGKLPGRLVKSLVPESSSFSSLRSTVAAARNGVAFGNGEPGAAVRCAETGEGPAGPGRRGIAGMF